MLLPSSFSLVELVVNNAPDVEIWRAVFGLVALTSPKQLIPPAAVEKAVFDTPSIQLGFSERIKQTHVNGYLSNSQAASIILVASTSDPSKESLA